MVPLWKRANISENNAAKKLIVNIIRVMKWYQIEKGIHSKGIDYFTGNYSYLRNF